MDENNNSPTSKFSKRMKLNVQAIGPYCERHGKREEHLRNENAKLPTIGTSLINNGLVLELLKFCNVHAIENRKLFSWVDQLVKPCKLEDICNFNNFMVKVRRLKEKAGRLRGNKSKVEERVKILDEPFPFTLNTSSNSPLPRRKRAFKEITNSYVQLSKKAETRQSTNDALKHDYEELLEKSNRLKLQNANLKGENEIERTAISEKENLLEEQTKNIDNKEEEIKRLTMEKNAKGRKLAGLKAKNFWKEKASANDKEVKQSKTISTQTNLKGTDKEIIQVLTETGSNFVKEAKVYNEVSPDKSSRISDGKIYISKIPIRRVATRHTVRSEKVKRAEQAFTVLKYVAAKEGDCIEENDLVPILATWFRQNPRLMQQAADAAGVHVMKKLTAEQTADLRACRRFSNSTMRMVRTFFNKTVSNMCASERQVRKIEKERVSPLLEEKMEVGTMVFEGSRR